VQYLLDIGGIETRLEQALGREITLAGLRRDYDAVFLGLGLAGVNALGLEAEQIDGVYDAVEYIARLRQTKDLSKLAVGRRIVVIGGGMTAIDIATQTRLLGAEDVTIVYRRGKEQMGASPAEQEWAQTNGVKIKHWAKPARLLKQGDGLQGIEFEYTRLDAKGRLAGTGEKFSLDADMVFKAIGQTFVPAGLNSSADVLELSNGRITVDDDRRTSLPMVWAGGDCVAGGKDLTVAGVQDGKVAAISIDRTLRA